MSTPSPETPRTEFSELLAQARTGDVGATGALFEQFYPRVERLVHHSLSTDMRNSRPWLTARFSTGDVVQEVFRSVLGDLSSFGGDTEKAFVGYLTMVVRNRIIDTLRFHEAERRDGRRGAPPLEDEQHPPDLASPEHSAETADDVRRLYELLSEFPERERLLLRARIDGSASFAELKERLGYPSVTSTRRAFFNAQARLALRLGLNTDDADASDARTSNSDAEAGA